jgi:hypothetical protein
LVGVVRDRLKGVVVMKKTIIGAMKMEGVAGVVEGYFLVLLLEIQEN